MGHDVAALGLKLAGPASSAQQRRCAQAKIRPRRSLRHACPGGIRGLVVAVGALLVERIHCPGYVRFTTPSRWVGLTTVANLRLRPAAVNGPFYPMGRRALFMTVVVALRAVLQRPPGPLPARPGHRCTGIIIWPFLLAWGTFCRRTRLPSSNTLNAVGSSSSAGSADCRIGFAPGIGRL